MFPDNKTEAFHKKRIPTLFTHHSSLLTVMIVTSLTIITGCSDKEKEKSLTEGGMKCGAGKCGSSMVDGSAVLVKKKMNILDQIPEDDYRRACVLEAKSTKALYNCVRDPKTGRLTIQESSKSTSFESNITVKKEKKAPQKENKSTMKCQAGKCSSGN